MSARNRIPILVLAIVLVGLGLRIWYASETLRINRFVDEKYSLMNIRAIVAEGTLEPASSYYPYPLFNVPPAALVAGSEALHDWTGSGRFEAFDEKGYRPVAFFLTRLVQALYGALALFLTYLVGRELFSPEAGWLGALLLAFMPWHIHASGYFKPDAQLVAMVLLAFYWSLKAIDSPSWKSYLLAGIGIALAMSTKMTGGIIAIPLVIGTLASGWRDKRRLGLLVMAGVTSAAIFVLLNPYWRFYPAWLSGLEKDYAMRAARQGMTRWQIPGRLADMITDPFTLGPWLGVVGLVAFLVLGVSTVRSQHEGGSNDRAKVWMFLGFPVIYAAAYAWKTPYFKDNNFLPVIPFFCLLIGWTLAGLWRSSERRWPELASTPFRVGAILLVCLVAMPPGLVYAYRTTTPTTTDRALAFLGRKMRPATGRLVFVEQVPMARPVWEGGRRFGRGRSRIESVEDWREISEASLDLADGRVLLLVSVGSGDTDSLSSADMRRFEPRWFEARGPALLTILHDWQRSAAPVYLPVRKCRPSQRCRAADLGAEVGEAEWISLVVTLGFARGASVDDVTSIRVGDRELPLLLASRTERGAVFITEKFTPPGGAEAAVFEARKELLRKRQFGIELHRWRRSGS